MLEKAESEEYLNYSWVRDMFELMVLNALVFNRFVSIEEVSKFKVLLCFETLYSQFFINSTFSAHKSLERSQALLLQRVEDCFWENR